MPIRGIFLFAIVFIHYAYRKDSKIKIFLAGDSTMSVKEISAYPETGWGMPFIYFWDSSITVINRAKNGRSTKTFIQEGLWKSIMDEAARGDYIFIQFGHNDESPEKKDRYSPPDSFKMNLLFFIKEAKDRGAIPVLLTPVGRRKFDSAGQVMETHAIYAQLIRDVARDAGILLIDLDDRSQLVYQRFGKENSRLLFLQLKPGEHPNYPDGKEDNTHFNEMGARLIAEEVLAEIRLQIPELAGRIIRKNSK